MFITRNQFTLIVFIRRAPLFFVLEAHWHKIHERRSGHQSKCRPKQLERRLPTVGNDEQDLLLAPLLVLMLVDSVGHRTGTNKSGVFIHFGKSLNLFQ